MTPDMEAASRQANKEYLKEIQEDIKNRQIQLGQKRDELSKITHQLVSIDTFTVTYEGCSFKIPDISMQLKLTYQFVLPQITITQLTPQEAAQLDTSNIVTPTAISQINSQHSQRIKDTTAQQTQVLSQQEIKTEGKSQVPQSDVLNTLLNKSTVKSSVPPTPRAVIAYVPRERFVGLEAFPQKQKK